MVMQAWHPSTSDQQGFEVSLEDTEKPCLRNKQVFEKLDLYQTPTKWSQEAREEHSKGNVHLQDEVRPQDTWAALRLSE